LERLKSKKQLIIKNLTHMKSNWKRQFLGKTENFESKEEMRKEQKHLKAYLKGHTRYAFGRDIKTKEPIWHNVKQISQPLNTH